MCTLCYIVPCFQNNVHMYYLHVATYIVLNSKANLIFTGTNLKADLENLGILEESGSKLNIVNKRCIEMAIKARCSLDHCVEITVIMHVHFHCKLGKVLAC